MTPSTSNKGCCELCRPVPIKDIKNGAIPLKLSCKVCICHLPPAANKSTLISKCCKSTMTTDCADEGTCCYLCDACKNPTDQWESDFDRKVAEEKSIAQKLRDEGKCGYMIMTHPRELGGTYCAEKRPCQFNHPFPKDKLAEEKRKRPSERIVEIWNELKAEDEKTGRVGFRAADAIIQYLDEIHEK